MGVRYRFLLPAGHLIVDAAILGLLIGPAAAALVDAGNMPAAVVSHAICQARDPFWLLTHETISLTIWFLTGLGVDLGRFRLRTEMLVFLALRAVLVAGTRASNSFWRPAASLEGLVWLALAIWGAGWCVNRFRSTAPSRSRLRFRRVR
jgi:hypothetical protein